MLSSTINKPFILTELFSYVVYKFDTATTELFTSQLEITGFSNTGTLRYRLFFLRSIAQVFTQI